MSEVSPALADFDRVAPVTQRLVDNVRPDQWEAATPCEDWTVRQLVNHIAIGNLFFTHVARGETTWPPTPEFRKQDVLGEDPAAGFRTILEGTRAAFNLPGFLEGRYGTPMGEQTGEFVIHMREHELLVHGWDLARATGQAPDFPDDVVDKTHERWRAGLAGRPREGSPFKDEQPVADDAPRIDKLAAFLGRTP